MLNLLVVVNCSLANECNDDTNCTGNDPLCFLHGGIVNGLGIPSSWCTNSTGPINSGVCGGESFCC